MGAALVEQAGVVRHDDGGHVGERVEVVLDPGNVEHVQMVGRLVEQQNVGVLQHGAGQRELHAPATGEGGDGVAEHLVGEAHGLHDAGDLLAGGAALLDALVSEHVLEADELGHLALNISLDEDRAQLGGRGESLDLAVGDGAQQGGLAGVVATEQTVAETAAELEAGVVQEDLGAVGKSELAVAQLLGVLSLVGRVDRGLVLGNLGEHRSGGGLGLIGRDVRGGQVRDDSRLPGSGLHVGCVGQGGADDRGPLDREVQLGGVVSADLLRDHRGDGLRGVLGTRGRGGGLDALQLLVSLAAGGAGLGVGDLVGRLLEGRQEHGQERGGLARHLDELGHVGHNDGALALERGVALAEAAVQKRDDEAQCSRVNGLHEREGGQLVDGLRDLVELLHGLGEGRDERLDIAVVHNGGKRLHGVAGGGLDFGAEMEQIVRNRGHQGSDVVDELRTGRLLHLGEELQAPDLHLPLRRGEASRQGGDQALLGSGLRDDESPESVQCGARDRGNLLGTLGSAVDDLSGDGDQVRHSREAELVDHGVDDGEGTLAKVVLLLVGHGSLDLVQKTKLHQLVGTLRLQESGELRDGSSLSGVLSGSRQQLVELNRLRRGRQASGQSLRSLGLQAGRVDRSRRSLLLQTLQSGHVLGLVQTQTSSKSWVCVPR
mmetsp:Transcript_14411/g.33641  ORF Transcript_14411/g.33641 Transcript_14411/m.33641 type:complete len:660 (-) Transcript_14411:30-2009(-)